MASTGGAVKGVYCFVFGSDCKKRAIRAETIGDLFACPAVPTDCVELVDTDGASWFRNEGTRPLVAPEKTTFYVDQAAAGEHNFLSSCHIEFGLYLYAR